MTNLFTDDFKPTPYWWDAAPLAPASDASLPTKTDVLIIGSGYTGLHAAIQTARAGLSTLIVDANDCGYGASTRNGGQVSTSIKPSYDKLKHQFGAELACNIMAEGQASLDYIKSFIAAENVECDYQPCGRFHGAHSKSAFEKLQRTLDASKIKTDAFVVSKHDLSSELGTDVYHGGVVYPHHASVHPAKYHQSLRNIATNAGTHLVSFCPVTAIDRTANCFSVTTKRGTITADQVILATNGYSGGLSNWHQRRVIPIGSYIIATDEIPTSVMDEIMPTNRVLSDTRKLVYYYRPSPDRKRILFGGRVSLSETDPKKSAPKLHQELTRIFPQLLGVKVSHSWTGKVGYTFDSMMHTGNDRGLHFAMGYCGSGVGMASYLGMRIGQTVAGLRDKASAFDDVPFRTRPYYFGHPWFLVPSVMAYRLRDRLWG
ncbi:oxidoreductase [Amylibacter kogurei]|uniref:Oxidoreductase n=1 Tax=Paramylibacter kogurei TaxID=1889778 RepID=A0A2G5K5D4_9RHOB|nr:FAD-binding oxidoreductase [Amylibacter kogurei]PIB24731.1 oxidoreductase [Amylibacter kogurei]